jgi:hypothetical protein
MYIYVYEDVDKYIEAEEAVNEEDPDAAPVGRFTYIYIHMNMSFYRHLYIYFF